MEISKVLQCLFLFVFHALAEDFGKCFIPGNVPSNLAEKGVCRLSSRGNITVGYEVGETATLKCSINTKDNSTSLQWSKNSIIIARNLKASSAEYTLQCSNSTYTISFAVRTGNEGIYRCGCEGDEVLDGVKYHVKIDIIETNPPSRNFFVGLLIILLVFVATGCFHLGSILALIILGIQMKRGCNGGRVCRPCRLFTIMIGEGVLLIAVPGIAVLQSVGLIPPCCDPATSNQMVGIAVVLCIVSILIIIMTVVVYRKIKNNRNKRRRRRRTSSSASRQVVQEAGRQQRIRTISDPVAQEELMESVIDLAIQRSLDDATDRPPASAPSLNRGSLAGLDSVPPAPPPDHEPLRGQVCCICYDAPVQICFPQCGHANLCHACGSQIINGRGQCPLCNVSVTIMSVLYT